MEAPNRQPQLSDKHRHELIHGSGIPAEIVEREGLWSATAEEVNQLLGWDVGSGGIVFPYPGHEDFVRIRLDKPYMGPGYKKGAKYLSPRKKGNRLDRKSTRLNSSHVKISYAVFCLKKKKNKR